MIFSAVDNDRTARAVERQIETLVLEGVLSAGDRLPGERELSGAMDVSRPIIREAVASLEERNLLIRRHGGATVVADVIGSVFAEPIVQLIRDNSKARADYLEYRREIEGITASMAAKRATPADKELLSGIVAEMKNAHAAEDAQREAEIDVRFHNAICDASHNIMLLHTMRACYRLLEDDVFYNRELMYHREGMREALLSQHLAIHDAIIAGNATQAAEAAQAHIDNLTEVTREAEKASSREQISRLRLEKSR